MTGGNIVRSCEDVLARNWCWDMSAVRISEEAMQCRTCKLHGPEPRLNPPVASAGYRGRGRVSSVLVWYGFLYPTSSVLSGSVCTRVG